MSPQIKGRNDVEHRLARLEAYREIEQLAARYALAMDARDLDMLVSLYAEDVKVGAPINGTGREALREWFRDNITTSYRTFHAITGHVIEFKDDNHARGILHAHAEHEMGDRWEVTVYCCTDRYVRKNGKWFFASRRGQPFYRRDFPIFPRIDAPRRPESPGVRMPREFPTFSQFWKQFPKELVAKLTRAPVE
jgi:ketosteroid isomerase-like protein